MKLAIDYKKQHWKSLDGMRGMAILTVFMYHIFHFQNSILKNCIQLGWVGVDLFFVLSGFLITGILYDTKNRINYYRNFIAKRALRIFPLYYLVLVLFFTGVIFLKNSNAFAFHYNLLYAPYFFTYTQNILFAFKSWPPSDTLNHFWSLAIEEQFYLLWPFIILLNRKKILWIALSGILISIIIRNIYPYTPFAYVFTFARTDALLIGGVTAIIIREKQKILENIAIPALIFSFIILMLIIYLTGNTDSNNIYFIRFGYTLFDIFFAGILITLFDSGKAGSLLRKFFEINPLLFLGKYSYGIYVYHLILNRIFFPRIEKIVARFFPHGTYPLSLLVFSILVLLVSYMSYQIFEKKFLEKKKYFSVPDEIKS